MLEVALYKHGVLALVWNADSRLQDVNGLGAFDLLEELIEVHVCHVNPKARILWELDDASISCSEILFDFPFDALLFVVVKILHVNAGEISPTHFRKIGFDIAQKVDFLKRGP